MQYSVYAYVNVAEDNFAGYESGHPLAHVGRFTVKADNNNPEHAASQLWPVGNRMGCDLNGREWPTDVRSLSMGDVVAVHTPPCHWHPRGKVTWLHCARVGWEEITEPLITDTVPIEGTKATSRT